MHIHPSAVTALLILSSLLQGNAAASERPLDTLPNVTPEMLHSQYWIERLSAPNQVIMDLPAIMKYNEQLLRSAEFHIPDLAVYPSCISKQNLLSQMRHAIPPAEPLYMHGKVMSPTDWQNLECKLNYAQIAESIPVRYGFTLNRSAVRSYPTSDPAYSTPEDQEFDQFQETMLNPAEPLIILHQSFNGAWYYILAANYRGWIAATNVAIATSRSQWLDYWQTSRFVIVSSNTIRIRLNHDSYSPRSLLFEMGAKIPLDASNSTCSSRDYRGIIPTKDSFGHLAFKTVILPKQDVHAGFLPYTRSNILRQAFKMIGQPYGWGGAHDSVDCSGLTMNVYRCFGFTLPRNSGEQALLPGKSILFTETDPTVRTRQLLRLQPGALLFLKGHVMLYLGASGDNAYIIHALSSYGVPDPCGVYHKHYLLQVTVSTLRLPRANGTPILEALNRGVNLE